MDLILRRRGSRSLVAVLLLFLFFFSADILKSRADVLNLTAETFNDKVKEKDTVWFVQFCVPWCKYCKSLGTLWEDLGKAVEGEDEIEIGQVDCSTDRTVCSKVDIHAYPTFKVFYDGEEVAKYTGPKEVESLKSFVLAEAEKAAQKKLNDESDL
ncbi:hypothetical protein J5N97_006039 [Dioscorea zingiberensis]|uniref:Thioredoxin domain-containing protein n=1 Tax=Dioscorea zingiberensis TaxID=325984 RepID=A0A9D5DB94_9LILI|nr:hypothetical protein J5N97_006039 [Dioscorea zingiberensis]